MIILGSLESALWTCVNWTFFARCYGCGATSDYRLKIGNFAPTWVSWPKISGRRGRPPTNHFSSQKTRLNDLSYDIKIWTNLSTVFSQSTRVTDRRTDRQTDGQNSHQQIFRIGTVLYAECLWRMRRHGPVIAHCTDSEDFPSHR